MNYAVELLDRVALGLGYFVITIIAIIGICLMYMSVTGIVESYRTRRIKKLQNKLKKKNTELRNLGNKYRELNVKN